MGVPERITLRCTLREDNAVKVWESPFLRRWPSSQSMRPMGVLPMRSTFRRRDSYDTIMTVVSVKIIEEGDEMMGMVGMMGGRVPGLTTFLPDASHHARTSRSSS